MGYGLGCNIYIVFFLINGNYVVTPPPHPIMGYRKNINIALLQLFLWSKYSYAWICFAFALHTTYFKKYLKNDILNAKESSYLQKSNTFINIMLLNGTGGGYKNQKIQFTRIAGRFAPFLLRTHPLYYCILFVHKCLFVYFSNVWTALPFKGTVSLFWPRGPVGVEMAEMVKE